MMHVSPTGEGFAVQGAAHDLSRLAMLRAQVDAARRAAGESLERLNALAAPGFGRDDVSGALIEAHERDKEALFEAMRRLDAAIEGTAPAP